MASIFIFIPPSFTSPCRRGFTLTSHHSLGFTDLLAEQVLWQAKSALCRRASRERRKKQIFFRIFEDFTKSI
jgi:hypothetical protein